MKKLLLCFSLLALAQFAGAQYLSLVQGTIQSSASSCQVQGGSTACVFLQVAPQTNSADITVAGTYSGTLQFEVSGDGGASWVSVNATPPSSTTAVTSTTSTGTWTASMAGHSFLRVRCSTYSSGVANVTLNPSQAVTASTGGGSGSGTVTSIVFSAPLTGGTVTSTGTVGLDASKVCIPGSYAAQTDGATVTYAIGSNMCANGSLLFTVHSGSRTLNLTGMVNGGSYLLKLTQDATGGEGLTLGTGCTWKVSGGGAGAITPSTGANAVDVLAWTYDGTNCLLNFNTNFN